MQFWQPCRSFVAKMPKKNSVIVRKWVKKLFVSNKPNTFKTCLWTHRMQFWQPCLRFLARSSKFFSLKLGKSIKNYVFFSKDLLRLFTWIRKKSLVNIAEIFLSNFRKKMAGSPKTIRKNMFFSQKLFFLEMLPWTPILHFWQACRRFSANVG